MKIKNAIRRAVPALIMSVVLLVGMALGASAAPRERMLIPGGVPFGVRLYCEGIMVVGISDVSVGGSPCCPAKDAGVHVRDMIVRVNGKKVTTSEELVSVIGGSGGAPIELTLKRGSGEVTLSIVPVMADDSSEYKTGLWIRDSTAGIGTVTFVDPETGAFAGLGHGICDPDTGELVKAGRGIVVNVSISGVAKGQAGVPGELKGYFSSGKIGTLIRNSERGAFGVLTEYPEGLSEEAEAIPAADSKEIKEGEAELICTADGGGIGRYKVRISGIDHSGRAVKNFVVTVTDPDLISKTGGIVQGMSGSPIIQNGKLIGALTHVLVNDPERGYGIFIENMLSAQDAA